jgi:hypothetical protein
MCYVGAPTGQYFNFAVYDRMTVDLKMMSMRKGLKANGGFEPGKCHIHKILTLSEAKEEEGYMAGLEPQIFCTEPPHF